MRAGEKGVTLQLLAGFDVTEATVAAMKRRSPGGATDSKTLEIPDGDDGTAGVFSYLTGADDFTEGEWELQLVVDFGSNQRLKSPIATLTVDPSL